MVNLQAAFASNAAGIVLLPPCFKHGNGNGIRQIHAAVVRQHGKANFLVFGQSIQNLGGQAARFRSEHKHIARLESRLVGARRSFGGERENAPAGQSLHTFFPIFMHRQPCEFMIIQTRALHLAAVQRKAQRLHQMQAAARVGAQTDNVARVGRNFWLIQNNGKHIIENNFYN